MKWIKTSDQLPPQNKRILVYGSDIGIMAGEYHYWPAWELFDEEKWQPLRESHPDIFDLQKRMNELSRGEKEKHLFICACEDSNWPLDVIQYWMFLPEEPK